MFRRQKENRPFSVQNIVDALQKQGVKKTAVERALATLVEKGQVNKKEYGKAKVFLLAQDKLELPNAEDVTSLDKQVSDLVGKLNQCNQRVALKSEDATSLKSQYTLQDAKKRVDFLEGEIALKTSKRSKLGDGSMLFSKEEKLAIDKSYYDLRLLWKRYRGLVNRIIDQISEGTGKKKSELNGEIGIETDEDVNVNLHEFVEIANPSAVRKGGLLDRNGKRQRQS